MRIYLLLFTIGACALYAEEPPVIVPSAPQTAAITTIQNPSTPGKNLWRASVVTLAAANVMDVHSSWGKHELNSTLASPTGTFGRQGALLKLGFQGGLVGLEYLITRGHSTGKLYRSLAFINFGATAVIGSVAAHNYTIPRQ